MTKAELQATIDAAHAMLDRLGVGRGDEGGAWSLDERIRKLADATTAPQATISAAHEKLDRLGVARGYESVAFSLQWRIGLLADATADVRNEAHRLMHGEE